MCIKITLITSSQMIMIQSEADYYQLKTGCHKLYIHISLLFSQRAFFNFQQHNFNLTYFIISSKIIFDLLLIQFITQIQNTNNICPYMFSNKCSKLFIHFQEVSISNNHKNMFKFITCNYKVKCTYQQFYNLQLYTSNYSIIKL